MPPARPDNNAALLTVPQSTSTVVCLKAFRMLLGAIERQMRAMDYQGADLTLALRHVEDARMRCGKAMEPFDTGFVRTDLPTDGAIAALNACIADTQALEGSREYSPRVVEPPAA